VGVEEGVGESDSERVGDKEVLSVYEVQGLEDREPETVEDALFATENEMFAVDDIHCVGELEKEVEMELLCDTEEESEAVAHRDTPKLVEKEGDLETVRDTVRELDMLGELEILPVPVSDTLGYELSVALVVSDVDTDILKVGEKLCEDVTLAVVHGDRVTERQTLGDTVRQELAEGEPETVLEKEFDCV